MPATGQDLTLATAAELAILLAGTDPAALPPEPDLGPLSPRSQSVPLAPNPPVPCLQPLLLDGCGTLTTLFIRVSQPLSGNSV
jgi:hypothetical protein